MRVLSQFLVLALLIPQQLASAQDKPGILTDEQLHAAMDFGNNGKPAVYKLDMGSFDAGWVTTPFMRVAIAARRAKESYKPFSLEDAKALNDGTVHIAIGDTIAQAFTKKGGKDRVVRPEQIIVLPKESKNINEAVRPIDANVNVRNFMWMGSDLSRVTVLASFPTSVITKDQEFVMIYAENVFFGKRELRALGQCGRYSNRGCVEVDKRDPLYIKP